MRVIVTPRLPLGPLLEDLRHVLLEHDPRFLGLQVGESAVDSASLGVLELLKVEGPGDCRFESAIACVSGISGLIS